MEIYTEYKGLWFREGTNGRVREYIASVYQNRDRQQATFRIAIKYFNEDEISVYTIGRSTGRVKVPLEIKRRNSMSGGEMTTDMIETIRVKYTDSKYWEYRYIADASKLTRDILFSDYRTKLIKGSV